MINKPLSKLAAALLLAATLALATTTTHASDISAHIVNLDSSDYAIRQTARLDLRQTLVDAKSSRQRAYEKELIQHIGTGTPFATRDWNIRMLELIGTKTAVKPLTALLSDPDPRISDNARRTLSAIPSSSAISALAKALETAAPADQPAYIDALAYRGESRAVRPLTAVLKSGTPASASHAATALAKINGRSARSALQSRHATATGALKADIERALIEAGLTDRKLAADLALSGQSPAIRTAAFAQLTSLDRKAATKMLQTALTDPAYVRRDVLIKAAISSPLRDQVITQLATLPPPAQAVALGAIADQRLTATEADVLALLPTASEAQNPLIIRTLGLIGSDQSYAPLYALYVADNGDRTVSDALARLQAPSADKALLSAAQGTGPIEDRVSALRLLVLRNTTGVTPLINQLAQPGQDPAIRQAAFKAMEVVGDPKSIDQLLAIVLASDPLKRLAQGSLKKLSFSLGVPDHLWTNNYQGALKSAPSHEARQGVLEILDGISGPAAAVYVQSLILTDHPLRTDALTVLTRWSDISAGQVWLALAKKSSTPTDQTAAKTALKRLISSNRVTGGDTNKVKLAAQSLTQFQDPDFRTAVLKNYEGKLSRDTTRELPKAFRPLLNDPALASQVQAILDRL